MIVSSPSNSAETVELEDRELTIISTNELQRQLALSRYSDWTNTTSGRSKSKSPRRSRRNRNAGQLPSPPRSPPHDPVSEESDTVSPLTRQPFSPEHSHKFSTASSPYPAGNSTMSKASRRPHTSAGPRDRSSRLDTRTYENFQTQTGRLTASRPETAHFMRFSRSPASQKSVEVSRLGSNASVSSGEHLSVERPHHTQGSLSIETVNLVEVQAWEQELARIESASQRNSADMLGFLSQRKKVSVEQPSIPTFLRAEG